MILIKISVVNNNGNDNRDPGADPGFVRSNSLKWNGNIIFTILFLVKKRLVKLQ